MVSASTIVATATHTIPIRHFDDSEAPEKTAHGRYGLVRGNEYRIHLTRILRHASALPP